MKKGEYDVIVVGSGMGGTCSAALLARSGYKVLLLEKLDRLGGRFSTVEQEAFKLPTGAVCIATRGETQDIYKECGAEFNVRETSSLDMWLDGKWYQLPEKGQLRTVLGILEKAEKDKAKVVGHIIQKIATEKIIGAFRGGPPKEKPGKMMSFREWILQYTDNERVLQMFQALTSAISGVNDFEYPASYWFAYTSKALGGQGGLTYYALAPNGNIKVIEALANTIKARGGDVWLGSPVKRILIEGGMAKGAIVEKDGKELEISARVVISDGGPKRTVELAGRESFDASYLTQVDNMRTVPTIVNLVASDKPLTPARATFLVVGARRIVTCVAMSTLCPELAPSGQHLMVVWGTPANCINHINAEEEVKTNLEDIRQVFPDFDKHGRILKQEVRDIDAEFPAYRSWHGYALKSETPVPNLYNVGDGVAPWGWEGLAACAHGARLVVNELKKKYKPAV